MPNAKPPKAVYTTDLGSMWLGDSLGWLSAMPSESVDAIITSPPFALTRAKSYGNHVEDAYITWFEDFAREFKRVLKDTGSLVIDLGGAWLPGEPTRSLYQFKLLLNLVEKFEFKLAEEFYWFNRAKLPGPRQWATIDRVRVKDAVNTLWWLSKTAHPKADNRKVLKPYSKAMLRMIERGTYNSGARPSEHNIGTKWAQDLGGAIPPNVIETALDDIDVSQFHEPDNMLDVANTVSSGPYHSFCERNDLKRHPARFPTQVPAFFIKFLTDPGDLVLDPFGGSNVTGAVAEDLDRTWQACELDIEFIKGSMGRFAASAVKITPAGTAVGLRRAMFDRPTKPNVVTTSETLFDG